MKEILRKLLVKAHILQDDREIRRLFTPDTPDMPEEDRLAQLNERRERGIIPIHDVNRVPIVSSEKFSLTCGQCGGCCSTSPRMSSRDMLRFSDKFLFQMNHQAAFSLPHRALSPLHIEHYRRMAHMVTIQESASAPTYTMFFFVDFTPVMLATQESCALLVDGGTETSRTCSVHASRPTRCRLAPLDIHYDPQDQHRTLAAFRKEALQSPDEPASTAEKTKKPWGCDFSDKPGALIWHGDIMDRQLRVAFQAEQAQIRQDTDRFVCRLEQNGQRDAHFQQIATQSAQRHKVLSSITPFLEEMVKDGMIGKSEARRCLENQRDVAKKLIEQCLKPSPNHRGPDPANKKMKRLIEHLLASLEKHLADFDQLFVDASDFKPEVGSSDLGIRG